MFRPMRRKDREVSLESALEFLKESREGILATISVDNGYPYNVAVNHVVLDGYIYFHCAKQGHKIDNINANNNVSFFAVLDGSVDQKAYTTRYKSAHVFGKAYIVDDKAEYKKALYEIARKYTGKFFAKAGAEIASAVNKTLVVRIEIESIKGKASKK